MLWGRECAERRTQCSIFFMLVTLDVLKLSGWLKAFAFCRVEREEFVPRRQHVWAGKREKLDEGEILLAPV